MKKIKLSNGLSTLVDDQDFDYLNQWKWHLWHTGYAIRRVGNPGKLIWMHRVINQTPDGRITDHINQNRLDNRRCNLRTVTRSQSQYNRSTFKNNTSGHRGVSWDKESKKWMAYINIKGRTKKLGRYVQKAHAIKARQNAERTL